MNEGGKNPLFIHFRYRKLSWWLVGFNAERRIARGVNKSVGLIFSLRSTAAINSIRIQGFEQ
jgi:hypothetical protein